MKKIIWCREMLPARILAVISLLLIITGFFIPPMGVVDGSVLIAVGEMFAFALLISLPYLMANAKEGQSIEFSNKIFSIKATQEEDKTSKKKSSKKED